MSEWEAANISSSFENDNESLSHHSNSTKNNNLDHHNHDSNHDKNTNPKETPEAAIARLTTAYNTAMNAVGALYKLNDAISAKQKQNTKNTHASASASTENEARGHRDRFQPHRPAPTKQARSPPLEENAECLMPVNPLPVDQGTVKNLLGQFLDNFVHQSIFYRRQVGGRREISVHRKGLLKVLPVV